MVSKVSVQGRLASLPLGLWQGRNAMAERTWRRKTTLFMAARKQREQNEASNKIHPSPVVYFFSARSHLPVSLLPSNVISL
jgi:hypothetical protein